MSANNIMKNARGSITEVSWPSDNSNNMLWFRNYLGFQVRQAGRSPFVSRSSSSKYRIYSNYPSRERLDRIEFFKHWPQKCPLSLFLKLLAVAEQAELINVFC